MHRIPIRVLPEEKTTANKPFLGTAPISVPYVPPLANTFASTNVSTVPMVPNTGKSDAEIVFSGVGNLNLNSAAVPSATVPTNAVASVGMPTISNEQHQLQHQQLPPQLQPQLPQQSAEFVIPATSQPPIVELAAAAVEQPLSNAPSNMQLPPTNYQHSQVFGTVAPTSIPSLNESFNIPPTLAPSSVPASIYQTNPVQCKC